MLGNCPLPELTLMLSPLLGLQCGPGDPPKAICCSTDPLGHLGKITLKAGVPPFSQLAPRMGSMGKWAPTARHRAAPGGGSPPTCIPSPAGARCRAAQAGRAGGAAEPESGSRFNRRGWGASIHSPLAFICVLVTCPPSSLPTQAHTRLDNGRSPAISAAE